MATYKVLQDIEAEDKLLGPLTLKQFIFAVVFLAIGFTEFKLATLTGLSVVRWPIVIVLLFPMIIFGFLAAPISRDQPNDVWLLARIRFLIKPHKRIWNQDGISQLVTITAPKKLEQILTNGLNQHEVQSRLSALASTLDSRGWATKNVDVNMFAQPGYLTTSDGTDRLVAPSTLPVDQMTTDVRAADDMMDTQSNPTAQHLEQMVQASTVAHRQQVVTNMQNPSSTAAPADYWFMNQPSTPPPTLPVGMSSFQQTSVVSPGTPVANDAIPTDEDLALLERIENEKAAEDTYYTHLKTLQPIGEQGAAQAADNMLPPVMTPAPSPAYQTTQPGVSTTNPAILNLANNDDLNVATIARQARQISEADGEVVISLH